MSRNRGEQQAQELLKRLGIESMPVDPERIAYTLGVQVSYQAFDDDDVSGMLYRDDAKVVIGVNHQHAKTRQRFTIAHELGHLKLHEGKPIIVDKLIRVNWRDATSGMASDEEEIEANQFAAALLMPEEAVRRELKLRINDGPISVVDDVVKQLAKFFKVSPQAMGHRLVNLNILSQPG